MPVRPEETLNNQGRFFCTEGVNKNWFNWLWLCVYVCWFWCRVALNHKQGQALVSVTKLIIF